MESPSHTGEKSTIDYNQVLSQVCGLKSSTVYVPSLTTLTDLDQSHQCFEYIWTFFQSIPDDPGNA
jgi:hypothetical protein